MNTRILELIKNPTLIQANDLSILSKEISQNPYVQSIRALYLYGIHQFDQENYKKELTTTAAYTTDKKILYQLINGKLEHKQETETVLEEKPSTEIKDDVKVESNTASAVAEKPLTLKDRASSNFNIAKTPFPLPKGENKPVFVEGKQNRILFEGEEDLMKTETSVKIDLESTKESGVIVTQSIEVPKVKEEIKNEEEINEKSVESTEVVEVEKEVAASDSEEENAGTPEVVIPENKIENEQPIIEDSSELSFHGLDSFLPEVNTQSPAQKKEIFEPQKSISSNKHEEEMKRLIAEVEQKIREKKKSAIEDTKTSSDSDHIEVQHGINFSETQSFEVKTKTEDEKEILVETKEEQILTENKSDESFDLLIKEEKEETQSIWKPMSLSTNAPDAMISNAAEEPAQEQSVIEISVESKKEETPQKKVEKQAKEEVSENAKNTEEESVPVMNLSFFSTGISKIPSKEETKEQGENTQLEQKEEDTISTEEISQEVPKEQDSNEKIDDSNVPSFINTWQSWLKIDRTEEILKHKTEVKNKAIETFIENLPKISQLKDEVNFVVKEKTDDISHLMTETLANLYVEQKLYSKAMNAYQILAEKFPEKQEYFESKIKEIKESRGKS